MAPTPHEMVWKPKLVALPSVKMLARVLLSSQMKSLTDTSNCDSF